MKSKTLIRDLPLISTVICHSRGTQQLAKGGRLHSAQEGAYMTWFTISSFRKNIVPLLLKKHSNVLISGCGGGFDFFCGSPIGLELEKRGHKVVYSSYSFSGLHNVISSNKIADTVTIVDEKSKMKDDELMSKYFPEKFFCEWYQRTYGVSTKVYCYQGVSIAR